MLAAQSLRYSALNYVLKLFSSLRSATCLWQLNLEKFLASEN